MSATKILEREIQGHQDEIKKINLNIKRYKKDINIILEKIKSDINGTSDGINYGLVYEYSDRICNSFKGIKVMEDLIEAKTRALSLL